MLPVTLINRLEAQLRPLLDEPLDASRAHRAITQQLVIEPDPTTPTDHGRVRGPSGMAPSPGVLLPDDVDRDDKLKGH